MRACVRACGGRACVFVSLAFHSPQSPLLRGGSLYSSPTCSGILLSPEEKIIYGNISRYVKATQINTIHLHHNTAMLLAVKSKMIAFGNSRNTS